ncbi:MAG: four helix bundle protein [Planctomycetes bacterium]|nr:four helix bundle protein [Planctomycetota bacterium]
MNFLALETSLDLIRALRPAAAALRLRDANLHDQIRRAATSIALNLAEASGRCGKDRRHHFCIAAGSAEEVRAALRVASAWGELSEDSIATPLRLVDRLVGMLWKLTH